MGIASILCPTDFSEPSWHAMEHAVALAGWYGARVIPLHVQSSAYATMSAMVGVSGSADVPEETQIVHGTSPADAIAGFAAAAKVDLIVMGPHGVSGFQHLILGSVTETVLRQVECPVLTVPPRAHSTARLPFRHFLCPTDFSASSLAALRLACALSEEGDATLDVLHVIDEPDEHALFVARPYNVHHYRESYEHHVTEHLESVLPPSARERGHVRLLIVHGKVEDLILDAAGDETDVIAMGVGRGNAPAFGSTVNHVVRNARCPVLTVRR